MIKIDGVAPPKYPSDFSITLSDIDDGATTTRTMDGLLHRDRIAVKRKINLKYNILTWNDLSILLNMISNVFFEVTYPDSMTGVEETKTFYVGNRTTPVAKYDDSGELYWKGVAFNFIER